MSKCTPQRMRHSHHQRRCGRDRNQLRVTQLTNEESTTEPGAWSSLLTHCFSPSHREGDGEGARYFEVRSDALQLARLTAVAGWAAVNDSVGDGGPPGDFDDDIPF